MASEAKNKSLVTPMFIVVMMAFAVTMAFMLGGEIVYTFSLLDDSHGINQARLKETTLFVAGFGLLLGGTLGLVIGVVLRDGVSRSDDDDAKSDEAPPTG